MASIGLDILVDAIFVKDGDNILKPQAAFADALVPTPSYGEKLNGSSTVTRPAKKRHRKEAGEDRKVVRESRENNKGVVRWKRARYESAEEEEEEEGEDEEDSSGEEWNSENDSEEDGLLLPPHQRTKQRRGGVVGGGGGGVKRKEVDLQEIQCTNCNAKGNTRCGWKMCRACCIKHPEECSLWLHKVARRKAMEQEKKKKETGRKRKKNGEVKGQQSNTGEVKEEKTILECGGEGGEEKLKEEGMKEELREREREGEGKEEEEGKKEQRDDETEVMKEMKKEVKEAIVASNGTVGEVNSNAAVIKLIEKVYTGQFDGFKIEKAEEKMTSRGSISSNGSDSKLDGFGSATYGEIAIESIGKLIDLLEIQEQDAFYDLGSGVGKAVLQVALESKCAKAVGIELSPSRHGAAVEARKQLVTELRRTRQRMVFKKLEELPQIDFQNEDIRSVSLRDATVIYWNNVLFSEEITEHILHKFATELQRGSRILCFKKLCSRHGNLCSTKGNPCSFLELLKEDTLSCTWTPSCTAYIYKRN